MNLIRMIRRAVFLWKHWETIKEAFSIVDDPKSKKSMRVTEDLSVEEINGLAQLESLYLFFTLDKKSLEKDFKHTEETLRGENNTKLNF